MRAAAAARSRRSFRLTRPIEPDSEGTWAISYGDMITLLLTFFIIFFNVEKPDKAKTAAMQASLLATLSPIVQKFPANHEASLSLGKGKGQNIDETAMKELGARIHKAGPSVLVEFPEISFFGSGKIDLTKEGVRALQNFAKTFVPYAGTYQLGIRAFTDNKPVVPSAEKRFRDNLELSALRSVATMRTLQKAGIPINRMKLTGHGEFRRAAFQAKVDASAFARKVVLVIEPELKETP